MNLSVNIAGIRMKNPVMPASGTFGYGQEYAPLVDLNGLGAVVLKSITLEPREGNPQPRLYEVKIGSQYGLINCIGLQNKGVDDLIENVLLSLYHFACPIIVSIAGFSVDEFGELAQRVDRAKEMVAGIEVNVSCPNVEGGRIPFGRRPEMVRMVTQAVRQATDLPVIVKLTPNVREIVPVAKAAVEAGANAISLINTVKIRRKIKSGPHVGQWIKGGLSGPPIKSKALFLVSQVAQANLGVPIIGMGGITNTEDALDFFRAGATAVAVGTATFLNPNTMEEVIDGLEKHLKEQGIEDINQIVGEKLKGAE